MCEASFLNSELLKLLQRSGRINSFSLHQFLSLLQINAITKKNVGRVFLFFVIKQ